VAPETGKVVGGNLYCIDAPCGGSTNATVSFGQSGSIGIWNPASVAGRGISINLSSNLDAGTWSIAGRDVYGFKVTETITAASTMKSTKTYKYITAIMPSTTVTSTGVIVGITDTYGFPLAVYNAPYSTIWVGQSSNQTNITAVAGNHTFALASSATATSTNGDVRGTYASTIASNSTGAAPVRVTIFVSPTVANLGAVTATSYTGLFGPTQFSSV